MRNLLSAYRQPDERVSARVSGAGACGEGAAARSRSISEWERDKNGIIHAFSVLPASVE